jgi:ketosteroid isomerase-like protein
MEVAMYKTLVRAIVRKGIRELNAGNPTFLLKMALPDAELRFPGDNSWARMFRPVVKGREPHATHRGIDECRAFAQAFVDAGLRFEVEDILVNGPPWRTRVCIRAHDFLVDHDGKDVYNNRAAMFLEMRWGQLVIWEDYEDTERVAAWDRKRGTDAPTPGPALTSAG